MRNGVLITLAMSSNIVKTNYVGAQSLTGDQLTWLLAGAFASYPAGSLLLRVASFLSRDHIDAAAGGYLHLTSHYKQSRMRLHLEYLWREVFRHDPLQRAAGAGTARVPRPQPPRTRIISGCFPRPKTSARTSPAPATASSPSGSRRCARPCRWACKAPASAFTSVPWRTGTRRGSFPTRTSPPRASRAIR
ncbi:MAG: hypothetical protein M5U09_24015 [Gammaproteobacteria bacterium]|nr:hypothetical protein [Gammaproteobacteria bacterium]